VSPLTANQGVGSIVLTLVDVSDLKRRERALQGARDQLSLELRHMTRLQVASTRLGGPAICVKRSTKILAAALEITGADMGCVQQCDDAGVLRITGLAGFPNRSSISRAPGDGRRAGQPGRDDHLPPIALDDLADSTMLDGTASRDAFVNAGVRAMQSTPLSIAPAGFWESSPRTTDRRIDSTRRSGDGSTCWRVRLGDAIHRRQTETW
jgi:hypothetical protein